MTSIRSCLAVFVIGVFTNLAALIVAPAFAQGSVEYQLGVGDRIKISVFEEPDMTLEFSVDSTGVVTYPYMQEITLLGKTTEQLETELTTGLKGRVLVNPDISVSVVQYRPFSIGGEVKRPGDYPFQQNMTVQKAINLAGGVTEWSNGKRFKLEREKPTDTERVTEDTLVFPGDILTVLPRRF